MNDHEDSRFEALLREATAEVDPRTPIWPTIRPRVRSRAPFQLTLRFAAGATLAAAAGFVLALALPRPDTPAAADPGDLWTTFGYGLVEGTPVSISAVAEETEG